MAKKKSKARDGAPVPHRRPAQHERGAWPVAGKRSGRIPAGV